MDLLVYGTGLTNYALFHRPIMAPMDNNPLEGMNNGIKAKVTEYIRINVSDLLTQLKKDLEERSKALISHNLVWTTRVRIPHLTWIYANALNNIIKEASYTVKNRNQSYEIIIGQKYRFATFLHSINKNKADSAARQSSSRIRSRS